MSDTESTISKSELLSRIIELEKLARELAILVENSLISDDDVDFDRPVGHCGPGSQD